MRLSSLLCLRFFRLRYLRTFLVRRFFFRRCLLSYLARLLGAAVSMRSFLRSCRSLRRSCRLSLRRIFF